MKKMNNINNAWGYYLKKRKRDLNKKHIKLKEKKQMKWEKGHFSKIRMQKELYWLKKNERRGLYDDLSWAELMALEHAYNFHLPSNMNHRVNVIHNYNSSNS